MGVMAQGKSTFEQQNQNTTGQAEIMDSVQQNGIWGEHMKSRLLGFQLQCIV